MLKATLIGGALFGFLGGLPIIGALNCACCALFVAGGFLASFLQSKECSGAGVEFKAGSGAVVGLVSGLFYALASAITSGIVGLMFRPDPEQLIGMLEQFDLPPESIDMAAKFMEGSSGLAGVFIGFFFTLLIAAIFSTIGGLIGGAVFKVEPPPAPPAAQTPPPPPPDVTSVE
jgi:hypothetical protein